MVSFWIVVCAIAVSFGFGYIIGLLDAWRVVSNSPDWKGREK